MLKIAIDTELDFYPKISVFENKGLLTNCGNIAISIVIITKNKMMSFLRFFPEVGPIHGGAKFSKCISWDLSKRMHSWIPAPVPV